TEREPKLAGGVQAGEDVEGDLFRRASRVDGQGRRQRVERVPVLVQLGHVGAGQHRAVLVTADAAHRLRVADPEVNDGHGRGGEGGAGARVGGRAAAEGEDRVLAVQQVHDDLVLQLAEGG